MRKLVLLMLAALPAACAQNADLQQSDAPTLPPLAADAAEPRLALAEHLLAEYFSSDIVAPPTICLAVTDGRAEEALPPEQETALITRFPKLAPLSRCTKSRAAWQDSENEQPALVFAIYNFSCASATNCSGWASYTAGATAAPSSLYRMRYEGGRWQFERDRRRIAE